MKYLFMTVLVSGFFVVSTPAFADCAGKCVLKCEALGSGTDYQKCISECTANCPSSPIPDPPPPSPAN
jgi:hypothetical protein